MKKILLIGILAASVILLLTCENGFNILDSVETEVKIANDKFLVIKSVSPSDLSTNVNPGNEINIVFDRNINTDTITEETITIDSNKTSGYGFASFNFNTTTKILKVEPANDFFEDTAEYTITVAGIRGADGSELQNEIIWSFSTGSAPAGSIEVQDKDLSAIEGYTNARSVDVIRLSSNLYADDFAVSLIRDQVDSSSGTFNDASLTWRGESTGSWTLEDFQLADVDGLQTVYAVFRGEISGSPAYGKVEEFEITLDRSVPVIDSVLINNGASSTTGTSLEVDLTTDSTVLSPEFYRYSTPNNSSYTSLYSMSSQSFNFTVPIGSINNASTTVYVTVEDAAGNISAESFDSITVDNVAPGTPTVLGTSPTLDRTPTWSWNTGGGGGSGYQYQLDSTTGSWTNTFSTSKTWTELSSGSYTLYVRERDAAGNWSDEGSKTIEITVPSVSGSTATIDPKPTWTWGSSYEGIKSYQYLLIRDGYFGIWYSTMEESYTPSSDLSDDGYTLYVKEKLSDGTWSDSGSKRTVVSPVVPYDGQTGVPYRFGTNLSWREVNTNDTYTLQYYYRNSWSDIETGLKTNTYTWTGRSSDTTYTWRIVVTPFIGRPYNKGPFTFTTSRF